MDAAIGGCRHWELEFDQAGRLGDDAGLLAAMSAGGPTDLFVFSHGWNASVQSARELGAAMFGLIDDALPAARRPNAGFVSLLWPSLLFPEDEPAADGPVLAGHGGAPSIVGGAWARRANRPANPRPLSGAKLAGALAPAFAQQGADLQRVGRLLESRPRDPDRLAEVHRLCSGLVTTPNDHPEDDGESTARTARTRTGLCALAALAPGSGRAAEDDDGFGALWRGAREMLRVLTYYEMKNRAGMIGRAGLGPLLDRLREARPDIRIHLIGHSFGARLVAFALAGLPPSPATPVRSLLLLQGAFSHFSFATKPAVNPARFGALSAFADRVDGPLLSTFSTADRAGMVVPQRQHPRPQGRRRRGGVQLPVGRPRTRRLPARRRRRPATGAGRHRLPLASRHLLPARRQPGDQPGPVMAGRSPQRHPQARDRLGCRHGGFAPPVRGWCSLAPGSAAFHGNSHHT